MTIGCGGSRSTLMKVVDDARHRVVQVAHPLRDVGAQPPVARPAPRIDAAVAVLDGASLLSVEQARSRIVSALAPVGIESVALGESLGRVLAADVMARTTSPATDVSAMDGYALRTADAAGGREWLRVVGSATPGAAYGSALGEREAVRIFTGAAVPGGADAVAVQENAERNEDRVRIASAPHPGRNIRPAGLDFRAGATGLRAGETVGVRAVALAAAMNIPALPVRRRPRIAVFVSGDELVAVGDGVGASGIPDANGPALCAAVVAAGGDPRFVGIARDEPESLRALAAAVRGVDLLVVAGGASVGEHDLARSALLDAGLVVDFSGVAIRPGKPLWFGRLNGIPVLGLPGNPVAALVCMLVFVGPALDALLGRPADAPRTTAAVLGRDLPANDQRADYLRSALDRRADGVLVATPLAQQDSGMIAALAGAGCLVLRAPGAAAAMAGESVAIIPFGLSPAVF